VIYRLRDGVPTQIGEVVGHIGGPDGKMRVKLAEARSGGDRYVTSLPFTKIIGKA
jgi:hypothetical protein